VSAGLLLLLVGVLGYLVVLAQPFADATGGCGGG
jgi:preprotein translocase subunit Sss1